MHEVTEVTVDDTSRDPVVRQLREQISDTDRVLVETLNKRLKLVARMRRYKEARGLPFLDLAREEWMFNYLARANQGPLSREGLEEIYAEVLDLTKREIAASEAPIADAS